MIPDVVGRHLRPLTAADRPLLREATLANMNWNGPRFGFADMDDAPELSHYFTGFPGDGDFGFAALVDGAEAGVGWAVLLLASDPGYGFVDAETPELSLTTFEPYRGRGAGTALLDALIQEARRRGLPALSLSVEDANPARRLYERAGFEFVGRNGGSDTMLIPLG